MIGHRAYIYMSSTSSYINVNVCRKCLKKQKCMIHTDITHSPGSGLKPFLLGLGCWDWGLGFVLGLLAATQTRSV